MKIFWISLVIIISLDSNEDSLEHEIEWSLYDNKIDKLRSIANQYVRKAKYDYRFQRPPEFDSWSYPFGIWVEKVFKDVYDFTDFKKKFNRLHRWCDYSTDKSISYHTEPYTRPTSKDRIRVQDLNDRRSQIHTLFHKGYAEIFQEFGKFFANFYPKDLRLIYQKGVFLLEDGRTNYAMDHLKLVLKSKDRKKIFEDPKKESEALFMAAKDLSEMSKYEKAIAILDEAIRKDPKNSDAYLERAAAYFELGNFDLALNDFTSCGYIPNKSKSDKLGFTKGLIMGTSKGIHEALSGFIPSVLSSMSGLSHGLWVLATSPKSSYKYITKFSKECLNLIKDNSTKTLIYALMPEFKKLENKELSEEKQGWVIGRIIGKYGIEIFALTGSVKAMKAYRNLKKANSILTLSQVSRTSTQARIIQETANKWRKMHIESIGKFKKAEKILARYTGQYLTEIQARKILHRAGVKTFARPKGIPNDYLLKLSNDGGGMIYKHPNNTHLSVRVMPGKPHSPFPHQQKPYVLQMKDGKALDKHGNLVSKKNAGAHIPLNEFVYRE